MIAPSASPRSACITTSKASRDQLIQTERVGQSPPAQQANGEVFAQCLPRRSESIQSENDALADRVKHVEEAGNKLKARHTRLEDALTKALDRPVNAVADARSTSDSGSNVKHDSQMSHIDGEHSHAPAAIAPSSLLTPKAPVIRHAVVETTTPVRKSDTCPTACPCAAKDPESQCTQEK